MEIVKYSARGLFQSVCFRYCFCLHNLNFQSRWLDHEGARPMARENVLS